MYTTIIIPLAELPNVLRALNAPKPVEIKPKVVPPVKRGRGRPPKAK
jgi:hypothetical protein